MSSTARKKRKKSLPRRVKYRIKILWQRYWSMLIAILLGLITAFLVMPLLIHFINEYD